MRSRYAVTVSRRRLPPDQLCSPKSKGAGARAHDGKWVKCFCSQVVRRRACATSKAYDLDCPRDSEDDDHTSSHMPAARQSTFFRNRRKTWVSPLHPRNKLALHLEEVCCQLHIVLWRTGTVGLADTVVRHAWQTRFRLLPSVAAFAPPGLESESCPDRYAYKCLPDHHHYTKAPEALLSRMYKAGGGPGQMSELCGSFVLGDPIRDYKLRGSSFSSGSTYRTAPAPGYHRNCSVISVAPRCTN